MQYYNKADQYIHVLSQVLARLNRTFVSEKKDDSHTNLYFDPVSGRLYGRWIDRSKGDIIPALDLSEPALLWLDSSLKTVHQMGLAGRTLADSETEISKNLSKLGLSSEGYAEPMHYEIPEYGFEGQLVKPLDSKSLSEWSRYLTLANDAAGHLLGYLQQKGEIRIWPHHFDTGMYVIPNEKTGIGFGLAMEDAMGGAPYFYLAGYGQQSGIIHKKLPKLPAGRWETGENWKGAILTLPELGDREKRQHEDLHGFMKTATDWYLSQ